jgi:uncharacterized protein
MSSEHEVIFSGRGKIFTYTRLTDPNTVPSGFQFNTPYYVAIIELEEGPRITAQLTDFGDEKPEIGMPVEMVTRKIKVEGDPDTGLNVYGYKFRPPIRQIKP